MLEGFKEYLLKNVLYNTKITTKILNYKSRRAGATDFFLVSLDLPYLSGGISPGLMTLHTMHIY